MPNNTPLYSLHDCRAVKMELVGSTLSFFFPQGVFLLPEAGCEAQRSLPARLDVPLLDMDTGGVSTNKTMQRRCARSGSFKIL